MEEYTRRYLDRRTQRGAASESPPAAPTAPGDAFTRRYLARRSALRTEGAETERSYTQRYLSRRTGRDTGSETAPIPENATSAPKPERAPLTPLRADVGIGPYTVGTQTREAADSGHTHSSGTFGAAEAQPRQTTGQYQGMRGWDIVGENQRRAAQIYAGSASKSFGDWARDVGTAAGAAYAGTVLNAGATGFSTLAAAYERSADALQPVGDWISGITGQRRAYEDYYESLTPEEREKLDAGYRPRLRSMTIGAGSRASNRWRTSCP